MWGVSIGSVLDLSIVEVIVIANLIDVTILRVASSLVVVFHKWQNSELEAVNKDVSGVRKELDGLDRVAF